MLPATVVATHYTAEVDAFVPVILKLVAVLSFAELVKNNVKEFDVHAWQLSQILNLDLRPPILTLVLQAVIAVQVVAVVPGVAASVCE